jgi:alpha-L-rhamnosidase
VDKTLGDHESLGVKATKLIGTVNYYEAARMMQTFARMMGDKPNEDKFSKLSEQIKGVVLDNFYKKPVDFNKQTLYATLLYHDLLSSQEKRTALDSLLASVKNGIGGHFTTGIFGTKYILESLSQNGYTDKVFEIVNSTEFPGWGYMISRGATTVWETWKESDDVYSNCHPMFGTVTEWFFRWLGGIRPNKEVPGFKSIILGPNFPKGLNVVNCSYETPNGKIVSQWTREKDQVQLHIVIPQNSEATLQLPQGGILSIKKNDQSYELKNSLLVPGEYQIQFMPTLK